MKRVVLATVVAFFLLMSLMSAQSVDGRWTTALHAANGQIISLTLKSDGSKLSGTLYGKQPIPLEGTIDGNTLKMKFIAPTVSGGELVMNYVAIVKGDEIKFTFQPGESRAPVFGPKAMEFVATRVK